LRPENPLPVPIRSVQFRIAVRLLCGLVLIAAAFLTQHAADASPRKSKPAAQNAAAARSSVLLAGPVATQIGLYQEGEAINIVVDMSEQVEAHVSAMINPQRLFLDFQGLRFHASDVSKASQDDLQPPLDSMVTGIRFGAFMRGQGRIILDLAQPMAVEEQRFIPLPEGGYRLIIRLGSASQQAFAELVRPKSDTIITGTTPDKPSDIPVVVLDPGHGGIDSGASGPAGELEKAIVLQFALALKQRLEAASSGKSPSVRVVMTRSDDVFVPLAERVRIARQAKAALFISLHADALADDADVRGASIYVLSDRATDERSQRLADKENRADLAAGVDSKDDQDDVADILFDLARREARAFSNIFARGLAATLPKATRMHKTPLRGAGFRVLRAGDVPSVLLELGYLTTSEEARLMQSDEWRKRTADAAAEAIERFLREKSGDDKGKP
jgi:N-acetylmuramoyl-L-alanine amidase